MADDLMKFTEDQFVNNLPKMDLARFR